MATAAAALPLMLLASCTSGAASRSSSSPTAGASSSRPATLAFHTYIYSHLVKPWPLRIRYQRVGKRRWRQVGGTGVYSPTTIAYTTMGGSNCVEAPYHLVRASAHAVTFLSRTNGGPFCFDDYGTNLLVIVFNRPVLDPAHPVVVHLQSTGTPRHRTRFALPPRPPDELQLHYGSITGRSVRWFPGGRVRPLPERVGVFGAARRRVRTDGEGRFTMTGLPTGWYSLGNCVGCPTNPDCHGGARVFVHAGQTAYVRLTCRPMRRH